MHLCIVYCTVYTKEMADVLNEENKGKPAETENDHELSEQQTQRTPPKIYRSHTRDT